MDIEETLDRLVNTAMKSPRELVRLIDTVITEHDIRYSHVGEPPLIDSESLSSGQDRYVKERINYVYDRKMLNQIYRLASLKFTNSEVQARFRVNSQSARNKTKGWEDAGIVRQTGTRAAGGDQGGKPSYEYSIVDARIVRIITNRLVSLEEYEPEPDNESV